FTGILYVTIGLASSIYLIGGILAIMGILLQFINIPIMTVLQKQTERKMLGRMSSMLMIVSTGLVPVSYLFTSIFISLDISIQVIVSISGLVIMAIALYNLKNKVLLKL